MNNTIESQLTLFCERLLPRMLTQVCRDPGSPGYGSFDRNWWHYKIRDFSSSILQQGGYALFCASQLPHFKEQSGALRELAAASCRFWNQRAIRHGAFEEYYPWEQGYPPVAFSSLAVAKMVAEGVLGISEVQTGLEVAARQLQDRFESKATNQQVAGTAALCWIRKIAPQLIDEERFQNICNQTLACQHEEGWYMEYGGPDIGYLAVTMDCLWDAFDATGDERFYESAAKALDFIAPFVSMPLRGAGMHNARNTDYIVPYGIARFVGDDCRGRTASFVLRRILENIEQADHFLYAVDDRYFCHYIGHSLFRSVGLLSRIEDQEAIDNPHENNHYFEGTGQWLCKKTLSGCSSMVSAKKGGIITIDFEGATCSDFGWIISQKGKEWVSHWWGEFWKITREIDQIEVSGHLTPHQEQGSTPFKHMALRCLSLVFGRRIIGILKEKMIFKEKESCGIPFTRKIMFQSDCVVVIDIFGIDKLDAPRRAPRSSKRHVASADGFHQEDVALCDSLVLVDEVRTLKGKCVEIITSYRRKK